MRSTRYWLTALSLVTIAGLVFWWMIKPIDPINGVNFDRIEVGMHVSDVEGILGTSGDEGNGDGHGFPMSWQGRGRNTIVVHFQYAPDGNVVASKSYFNPSLWDRVKEWWGGYELHPDGGRSKRLDAAA